jgi:hypothetical protein
MQELQTAAREAAEGLVDPDRKQLRFNEIVAVAQDFYRNPFAGVDELVASCDRSSPLYVKGSPMWASLRDGYGWMLDAR